MTESNPTTRREWLGKALMGMGLALSYGLLAVQGMLFVMPKHLKARTRLLFAGQVSQYEVGSVQSFFDLQGNEILVHRAGDRDTQHPGGPGRLDPDADGRRQHSEVLHRRVSHEPASTSGGRAGGAPGLAVRAVDGPFARLRGRGDDFSRRAGNDPGCAGGPSSSGNRLGVSPGVLLDDPGAGRIVA